MVLTVLYIVSTTISKDACLKITGNGVIFTNNKKMNSICYIAKYILLIAVSSIHPFINIVNDHFATKYLANETIN